MFLQSAFVDTYSRRAILWLLKFGYKPADPRDLEMPDQPDEMGIVTSAATGTFTIMPSVVIHYDDTKDPMGIHCNRNVEMFLGLTALRDDTSKDQYFKTDITDPRKVSVIGAAGTCWVWYNGFEPEVGDMLEKGFYHKMSVPEILNDQHVLQKSHWEMGEAYLEQQYGHLLKSQK